MPLLQDTLESEAFQADLAKRVANKFRSFNYQPSPEDIRETSQIVVQKILNPEHFEERRSFFLMPYTRATVRFAVLTFLTEVRTEKNFQRVGPWLTEAPVDEAEISGPFRAIEGFTKLSIKEPDDGQVVCSPFLRVEFANKASQPFRYRNNGFYVPPFDVLPYDYVAKRKPGRLGLRTDMTEDELHDDYIEALIFQRNSYQSCLRAAIPHFLRYVGIQRLLPKDRRIVRQLRLTGDLIVSRKALGIPPPTFSDARKRIESKGWSLEGRKTGGYIYAYNPVLDEAQRFMDPVAFKRIMELRPCDLISSDEHLLEMVMNDPALDLAGCERLVVRKRRDLITEKLTDEVIRSYDIQLRKLIENLVERPTYGQGLDLVAVNRVLQTVSKRRAIDLVFMSIRSGRPIKALLSMTDIFEEDAEAIVERQLDYAVSA